MPSIELQTLQPSSPSSSDERSQKPPSYRLCGHCGRSDDQKIQAASIPGNEDARLLISQRQTNTESIEAPYHVFTPGMKRFIVFIASAVATLSGLSSNIYFPVQEDIAVVSSHSRFAHHSARFR